MNVHILTYHDCPNHGAYLQTFALYKTLQIAGYNVKIINYKNKKHWWEQDFGALLKYRRPIRFYDHFVRKNAFQNALKQLPLTRYTRNPLLVKKEKFGTVIIGSDVVWDYSLFGFDDLYFGELNANKIISYAASFGSIEEGAELLPSVKKSLENFDSFLVRDNNTRNIIENLFEHNATIVIDPTFLYSFHDDIVPVRSPQKYVLVYGPEFTSRMIQKIVSYTRKNDYTTLSVGYRNTWCDLNYTHVTPFQYLYLVKNANKVFTSTFHGSVFSIVFNKAFLSAPVNKTNIKINWLLQSLDLKHRLYNDDCELGEQFEYPINYDKVQTILKKMREDSVAHLIQSLN